MDLKYLSGTTLEEIIKLYEIDKSETGVYLIEKLIEETKNTQDNICEEMYNNSYDDGYNKGYADRIEEENNDKISKNL